MGLESHLDFRETSPREENQQQSQSINGFASGTQTQAHTLTTVSFPSTPPPPLHPPLPSPQAILCGEQLSFFFLLQVLFRHVLLGEITVDRLVRMTPEQLASPELATWREQETKHVSFLFSAVLISTMHIL